MEFEVSEPLDQKLSKERVRDCRSVSKYLAKFLTLQWQEKKNKLQWQVKVSSLVSRKQLEISESSLEPFRKTSV